MSQTRRRLIAVILPVLRWALRLRPAKSVKRFLKRALAEEREVLGFALEADRLIRIDTVPDAVRISMLAQKDSMPFLVPAHRSVWGYGFRYSQDEHPYVAYLRRGGATLSRFYELFTPNDLFEAFGPNFVFESRPKTKEHPAEAVSIPSAAPWLYSDEFGVPRTKFLGEKTNGRFMGSEHGRQHLGPISREKLTATEVALDTVYESLNRRGYRPDIGGWIRGYFLIRGSDFLFLICGGQHRAAAWTALGEESIPVIFQPGYPQVVHVNDLQGFNKSVALAYFNEQYSEARRRLIRNL